MIVVPIALFLIFVLLFTTFNSVKQSVLIWPVERAVRIQTGDKDDAALK